jgi:hypothetical protein
VEWNPLLTSDHEYVRRDDQSHGSKHIEQKQRILTRSVDFVTIMLQSWIDLNQDQSSLLLVTTRNRRLCVKYRCINLLFKSKRIMTEAELGLLHLR